VNVLLESLSDVSATDCSIREYQLFVYCAAIFDTDLLLIVWAEILIVALYVRPYTVFPRIKARAFIS